MQRGSITSTCLQVIIALFSLLPSSLKAIKAGRGRNFLKSTPVAVAVSLLCQHSVKNDKYSQKVNLGLILLEVQNKGF